MTGHRGAAGLAPENTIAGFRRAWELGCDAVELDVQLTRDGALAVIHDEMLERTTNGAGPVSACTMVELKRLDAGNGERVPALEEVFDLLGPSEMVIQIELKGEATEEPAAALTRSRGMIDRVLFTSFHHRRVLRIKELLPGVVTGILVACNPADPKVLLDSARADNLHVHQERIDRTLIELTHGAGHRVCAWGKVVDTAAVDRLIDLGVDAIGSDRPDVVMERLRFRGMRGDGHA